MYDVLEKAKLSRQVKVIPRSWVKGWLGERAQRAGRAVHVLHVGLWWQYRPEQLSKPIEHTPGLNPRVSPGHHWRMTCQCGSHTAANVPLWW